jgi:UDP-N-acetylmuramoylalanine--D-glutamate ligase
VLVAGAGVAGAACAEVLLGLGALVTVVDRAESEALVRLKAAGADVVIGDEPPAGLLDTLDDVIVSPGFAPHTPVVRAAVAAGCPVFSEPELAWRLRGPSSPTWLAVTGTNGKTTTTTMLAGILRAAGHRTATLGNIGEPLVHAALAPDRFDVLAVELSSFQLHWSSTMAPQAGALLNLADDHLEWHGTFAAYAEAKRAIWRGAEVDGVAIGNVDDPMVAMALLRVRGRTVGVSLGRPRPGELGVVDGALVDWAFATEPVELARAEGIRPAGEHNVSNALHAAALARSYGVQHSAVRDGLAGYVPEPIPTPWLHAGVSYVDDSGPTPRASIADGVPRIVDGRRSTEGGQPGIRRSVAAGLSGVSAGRIGRSCRRRPTRPEPAGRGGREDG